MTLTYACVLAALLTLILTGVWWVRDQDRIDREYRARLDLADARYLDRMTALGKRDVALRDIAEQQALDRE